MVAINSLNCTPCSDGFLGQVDDLQQVLYEVLLR